MVVICTCITRSGDHGRKVYDQHRHSSSTSDKKVTLEERQSGWLLRGRAHLPPCFSIQATSWVRCFRVLQTHQMDSCGTLPRRSPILAFYCFTSPDCSFLWIKFILKRSIRLCPACHITSFFDYLYKRKTSLGHIAAAIFLDHILFRTRHNSLKTSHLFSCRRPPHPTQTGKASLLPEK